MQVQNIKNINCKKPIFTSRVHMNSKDVGYASIFYINGIKKLQNNGQKDVVFLSLEKNDGICNAEIIMNVVKKIGKKLVAGNSRKNIGANLIEMYEEALKNTKPTEDIPLYLFKELV